MLTTPLRDPTGLTTREIVVEGEHWVCDLVDRIDVPQPPPSHHLRLLREAGFVTHLKDGRWSLLGAGPRAARGLLLRDRGNARDLSMTRANVMPSSR